MSDLILLIVASFTCYRLSELIAVDDGPGDIFKKTRMILGAYNLNEDGVPASSLGRAIICPYCIGIYFAAALALSQWGISWDTLLYWLAIAGGQAFLQNIGGRI